MQICQYIDPHCQVHLGAIYEGLVYALGETGEECFSSISSFLRQPSQWRGRLKGIVSALQPSYTLAQLDVAPARSKLHLLPPIECQEVWAAGVTYLRSREARMTESASASVYDRVYDAERPELFLKATPNRVAGPNDILYIRSDSKWNAPEPELVLVISPELELVGFTVGNDMSSRDIEGANPLYLPQAKVYRRCCGLGPAITLAEEISDPYNLTISMDIQRKGKAVFQGQISTSRFKRRYEELIGYLGRANEFPQGAFLFTGTGVVPPDDFTLAAGDVVSISIDGLGTLTNTIEVAPA